MIEFNIVRPDIRELVLSPMYSHLTYCTIFNKVKPLDIFYYRYDRDYAIKQVRDLTPVDCLKDLDSYIGRHFNNVDVTGNITDAKKWVADVKAKCIPNLPICLYLPSWKLFKIPLELIKELQQQNISIVLDECYEAFIDHLFAYFTWLSLSGVEQLDNIRIISGRFNGHPRLKGADIQSQDLDLEPIGVRVLSFPYFWFRSVKLYKDYQNRPISLERRPASVMCMNNWLRQHRILTLCRLLYIGALDNISWSALDPNYDFMIDLDRKHKELDLEQLGVDGWLTPSLLHQFKDMLPKFLDIDSNQDHDSLVNKATLDLHDEHLVNLVTETVYGTGPFDTYGVNTLPQFSDNYATEYTTRSLHRRYGFITEKTYKAIVTGQMFVLVGAANSLTNLRQLGFKTFGQYVDESYDFQINDDQRYMQVCDAAKSLTTTKINLQADTGLQEILEHNKEHFFDLSALTEQAYNIIEFFRETL